VRARRARLSLNVAGGALEGRAAGRGELLLGFLLTPERRRGPGFYAAGGVAALVTSDGRVERLVMTLGVESAPGGATGWYLEGGVGGGVRVAVGVRLRRLTRR
jgi:hypothetical protein